MAWTSRHFPFILMNYIWSREQKWNQVPASIVSAFTPQKDPNCDICLKTKITRASCRRRAGTVVPKEEHFGDLTTADHKTLSEGSESRNNHRDAIVVQDLATQQLGCVLQDSDELVSQGRKSRGNTMQKVLEPIQRVRFTKCTLRQASNQEKKGPSLGK